MFDWWKELDSLDSFSGPITHSCLASKQSLAIIFHHEVCIDKDTHASASIVVVGCDKMPSGYIIFSVLFQQTALIMCRNCNLTGIQTAGIQTA